jgi:hypothetical protein
MEKQSNNIGNIVSSINKVTKSITSVSSLTIEQN